ncbi:hypothetical protein F5Y14DRAFT_400781 [Nemania sp. NC0429]|nr:hypothetical protein F5Y14DRAFT_400781 [Nemania sp. NC0429]
MCETAMVIIVLKTALAERFCLHDGDILSSSIEISSTLATFVYWQSSRTTQPNCGQFASQFGRRPCRPMPSFGVPRIAFLLGAVTSHLSCLWAAAVATISWVLSEGDKRDSKGDMPESESVFLPYQGGSSLYHSQPRQKLLCSGASVSDSAEENPSPR